MSSSQSQGRFTPKNTTDPGWKYCYMETENDTTWVTCGFCGHKARGGISRAKHHLIGSNKKGVIKCAKCPQSVQEEIKEYLIKKKRAKQMTRGLHGRNDSHFYDGEDDEESDDEAQEEPPRKRSLSSCGSGSGSGTKGPMDRFMVKNKTLRQTSITECVNPKLRERACEKIGEFYYDGALAFNLAYLDSFKEMIQAIGEAGPNMKPPSYHELREPILNKAVATIEGRLKENVDETEKHGCSLMADGWEDRRHRTLINFLANNSKGTMFLDSVDASNQVKDGKLICELLEKYVDQVGEKNVVQVITDNGANYKLAGKQLMERRKNLFWTPCAAHCVDLMLEDIGKIPVVRKTISKAITFVGFIYRHASVLHLMWEFTSKRELAKHGTTRFATTFLTLQSLHKRQNELKRMFLSTEWQNCKWSKLASGIEANALMFNPTFWNNVAYTLKLMGPLVMVLRLADNEKKPAMGFIYEAMDRAKEAIMNSFGNNMKKCEEALAIIDKRWDAQLHHPLHAAGHFLNPYYFYHNPNIAKDVEVMNGLIDCVDRLVVSREARSKIMFEELPMYRNSLGQFGNHYAVQARDDPTQAMSPADWWGQFGNSAPNLRDLAMRILNLTTSSSGCERNWSFFELVHTKRRTKLAHKKLRDLVYVKYNRKLKARANSKKNKDPILLQQVEVEDMNINNEWLLGKMRRLDLDAGDQPVLDDNNLTWKVVAEASGVNESRPTRASTTRGKGKQAAGHTGQFRLVDESEEEGEFEDGDETEEEEAYVEEDSCDDDDADIAEDVGVDLNDGMDGLDYDDHDD